MQREYCVQLLNPRLQFCRYTGRAKANAEARGHLAPPPQVYLCCGIYHVKLPSRPTTVEARFCCILYPASTNMKINIVTDIASTTGDATNPKRR